MPLSDESVIQDGNRVLPVRSVILINGFVDHSANLGKDF